MLMRLGLGREGDVLCFFVFCHICSANFLRTPKPFAIKIRLSIVVKWSKFEFFVDFAQMVSEWAGPLLVEFGLDRVETAGAVQHL